MKRALMIGINYVRSPQNRLSGCANDVLKVAEFLGPNVETRTLSDDIAGAVWPSRKNILEAIAWLVRDLRPGDTAYVHYSGHGGLTVDVSGDEESGQDSCIYPVTETGSIEMITDDELGRVLVSRVPRGATCTVVLDCCHSGTCLDLRYGYKPISETELVVSENPRYPRGTGTVVLLSGCMDAQTASEAWDAKSAKPCGAMTEALLYALHDDRGPNAKKLKRVLWTVLARLRAEGHVQVPQLSSSVPFPLSDPLFAV
jgi:hypothetical protein